MANDAYKVVYTESAMRDIEEKADYILLNLREPDLAETWYWRLRQEIAEDLAFFPCKYPLYHVDKWAGKGVRQLVFRNDVILYSVDEALHTVYIRAVCTKGRDLSAHMEVTEGGSPI